MDFALSAFSLRDRLKAVGLEAFLSYSTHFLPCTVNWHTANILDMMPLAWATHAAQSLHTVAVLSTTFLVPSPQVAQNPKQSHTADKNNGAADTFSNSGPSLSLLLAILMTDHAAGYWHKAYLCMHWTEQYTRPKPKTSEPIGTDFFTNHSIPNFYASTQNLVDSQDPTQRESRSSYHWRHYNKFLVNILHIFGLKPGFLGFWLQNMLPFSVLRLPKKKDAKQEVSSYLD